VLLAAGAFIGNNTVGYIFMAYLLSYGTSVLGLSRSLILTCTLIAALGLAGDDSLGLRACPTGTVERRILLVGSAGLTRSRRWAVPARGHREPALMLAALVALAIVLGITYGPLAALALRAVPTERALQRRFPRLPDRSDPRRGDRAHGRGRPLRALAVQRADHALPGRGSACSAWPASPS
jgi:hypothetical protein